MSGIFIKEFKSVAFIFALITTLSFNVQSQTPEIPASVSFGGINVKFDRSAQNLIEEDVKSLMSNKKFWEEKMERAILYFPIVESILMDEEVPIDFKYLAVQESSFKPEVVSSSNAVGFWQFKPETARELNLRVDDEVDERKNISSSTHAAAWYLKKNNQQFNNWVSSLYSYYQGAGAVKKLVPANWAYAREVTLTNKTDRYMLRFFAHKIALEAGIERFRSNNKIVLLESEYGKGLSFEEVSRNLGINAREFESYNKWVSNGRIPSDREYLITVPVALDQVASVRSKLSLPASPTTIDAIAKDDSGYPILRKSNTKSNDKDGHVFYEINGLPGIAALPGDKPKTLAKIGDQRTPRFMKNNDMVKDMPLIPGNVYYLAKKNKKAATPFHTARPGDTWHSVSQQYGVRLVKLLNYNRTTSRNYPIQTGQVVWLSKKRPRRQPIEVIKPTTPVTPKVEEQVVAAETPAATNTAPTPVASASEIPSKPSGRKKYTPVLVEKSESAIGKESTEFEPAATPVATVPVIAEKTTTTQPNDRVVIITQDSDNESFKTPEEKTVTKKTPATTTEKESSTTYTPTNSVYQRKQREAAERAAREKEAASTTVAEKPVAVAKEATHVVKSGETYYSVARKYNMNVSDLFEMNNADGKKGLVVGQRIRVKTGNGVNAEDETVKISTKPVTTTPIEREVDELATTRSSEANAVYHTVVAGETYYSISRKYGITLKELMILNDMTGPGNLVAGQQLKVATGKGKIRNNAPATSGQTKIHTVASGETLFRISQSYGVSVDEIKRLNNMSGNNVVVGQKLKIPQK